MAVVDRQLHVVVANQAFEDLTGDSGTPRGRELLRFAAGRWDQPAFREALARVLPDDRAFAHIQLPGVDGGWLTVSGCALRPDDQPATLILLSFAVDPAVGSLTVGSMGVSVNRTAGRASTLQDALVIELAHRVKNLLAIVQSLALQTRGATVDSYRQAFLSRLKALALAHGALLQTALERAPLRALLDELLAPFLQDEPGRVVLDGPAVALPASQVTIFALIVHELASNAARHGALSVPAGRVLLSWRKVDGQLHLDWREQGGPPTPAGDSSGLEGTRGFGTLLIRKAATYQLRGTAELFLDPEGFHCSLAFPLKDAA